MTTLAQPAPSQRIRTLATALAASVPVAALLDGIYYLGGVAGTRDATPLRATAVSTAVAAIIAVLLWRFTRRGRGAVTMAVLAAVSTAGFWVGITFPVALAAVIVGRAAQSRPAIAVGVLAMAVATGLCVLGAS